MAAVAPEVTTGVLTVKEPEVVWMMSSPVVVEARIPPLPLMVYFSSLPPA